MIVLNLNIPQREGFFDKRGLAASSDDRLAHERFVRCLGVLADFLQPITNGFSNQLPHGHVRRFHSGTSTNTLIGCLSGILCALRNHTGTVMTILFPTIQGLTVISFSILSPPEKKKWARQQIGGVWNRGFRRERRAHQGVPANKKGISLCHLEEWAERVMAL